VRSEPVAAPRDPRHGSAACSVAASLEQAATICASRGARLTPLRREVLRLVLEAEVPATAYQLLDRLKRTYSTAVPPTIYRALDFLLARNLIHKVVTIAAFVPSNDPGRPRPAQFLICRSCRRVEAVVDGAVKSALKRASDRAGFVVHDAVVEVEGRCARCADPLRLAARA
jgi:Fur family zinc uptake transcriptional regulator